MEHLSNDHKDRPNQQEKAIVEQILASKKRNPKNRTMTITVWYPSREVNHLSKVI